MTTPTRAALGRYARWLAGDPAAAAREGADIDELIAFAEQYEGPKPGATPAPEPSAPPAVPVSPAPPRAPGGSVPDGLVHRVPVIDAAIDVQMTPLVVSDGVVLDAVVQDGGGRNKARTVLLQSTHDGNRWNLEQTLLEGRTAVDKWHNTPSLGLAPDGRLHAAANMHNFPWQHWRERNPGFLDMDFVGEPISQSEIDRHVFENKTGFPGPGRGAIPGQQVTYPHFASGPGKLAVGYRAAQTPGESFANRTFGGMVAVLEGAQWRARVVAAERGWTVYNTTPAYTESGQLHVLLFFRAGTAGAKMSRPCLLTGDALNTTHDHNLFDWAGITDDESENFSSTSSMDASDALQAVLLAGDKGGNRVLLTDGRRVPTSRIQDVKFHAGKLYGAGTGGRIQVLEDERWRDVRGDDGSGTGYARMVIDDGVAYVRTLNDRESRVIAHNL